MRVTEIIRGLLDLIDGAENQQTDTSASSEGYHDHDIKRFKQIVDLVDQESVGEYSNTPNEQYASVNSVTTDAGTDCLTGTKDPADIKGEHPSLYPGTVYGVRHGS